MRCLPGTYRYTVNNYSEFPSLSESRASVSLLLPDGSIETYDVPDENPTGEPVWIVGELECSEAPVQCEWKPLNTFGPAEDETYHGP